MQNKDSQNKKEVPLTHCEGNPRQGTHHDPATLRRRRPTLPHCGAVPSACPGLTSLFGMGRGGTPGPKPPDFCLSDMRHRRTTVSCSLFFHKASKKPRHVLQHHIPPCGMDYLHRQSRRAISSARLKASPPLHLHPINVVVCYGPQ